MSASALGRLDQVRIRRPRSRPRPRRRRRPSAHQVPRFPIAAVDSPRGELRQPPAACWSGGRAGGTGSRRPRRRSRGRGVCRATRRPKLLEQHRQLDGAEGPGRRAPRRRRSRGQPSSRSSRHSAPSYSGPLRPPRAPSRTTSAPASKLPWRTPLDLLLVVCQVEIHLLPLAGPWAGRAPARATMFFRTSVGPRPSIEFCRRARSSSVRPQRFVGPATPVGQAGSAAKLRELLVGL